MKKLKNIVAAVLAISLLSTMAGCQNADAAKLQDFEKELGKAGIIRVGISPDYAPFDFYDEKGAITGFDVEMAKELMTYLGSKESPYPIEFIPMDFSTIISSMNTGAVDLGISGFTYDPERDCLFSNAYLVSAQVIVVNKDSGITTEEGLVNASMAAGLNTVGAGVVNTLAEKYTGIKLVNPGDYNIMFESLKSGAVTAVVCDKAVAESFVNAGDKLMLLDGEYEAQDMSVIVKKSNTVLHAKINEAVDKFVASDAYMALKEKYGV